MPSNKELPFTHLLVGLRGLTVAGRVWDKGDVIPLDGSTPEPVARSVLEVCAALEHPHLTPGKMTGEENEREFSPLKKPVGIGPAEDAG